MTRFKNINGENIELTVAEESAKNTEELAYSNDAFNRALEQLRKDRNKLLAQTDYLALSDVTMSSAMTTYRQALRDLPDGKDTVAKCENAIWPTKP